MLLCTHVSDHGTPQTVLQTTANGKFTVVVIITDCHCVTKLQILNISSRRGYFPWDVSCILQSCEPRNVSWLISFKIESHWLVLDPEEGSLGVRWVAAVPDLCLTPDSVVALRDLSIIQPNRPQENLSDCSFPQKTDSSSFPKLMLCLTCLVENL